MAERYEDVENWLQQFSYHELQKLAGEYSIKRNQKKIKLIGLLKKVVKLPACETEKYEIQDLEGANNGTKANGRKRRHSSSAKVNVDNIGGSPATSSYIKKKRVNETIDESTDTSMNSDADQLNGTFDVSNCKIFSNASNILSGSGTTVIAPTSNPDSLSWLSEDGSEIVSNTNNHNLMENPSFELKNEFQVKDINNELSGKSPSCSTNTCQHLKEVVLKDDSEDNCKSLSDKPNNDGYSISYSEHDQIKAKDSNTDASAPSLPLSKQMNNVEYVTVESKNKKLANVKGTEYGKLTAQFAAKHKRLFKKATNIEEDAKKIKLLHSRHEQEVPQLFKRLATPRRIRQSSIPIPVRNAINEKSSERYDFSRALKDVSKNSFKFGKLDPGKTKDVEEAFQINQPSVRNALNELNSNAVASSLRFKNDDTCSRFVKNHNCQRKQFDLKTGNRMRSKKIISFVDTMTMSDAQLENAKKQGKVQLFMQRNRSVKF